MNITDFKAPDVPDSFETIVRMIFQRQAELLEKYKEIEQLPSAPISLHHAHGQRIIRDFAWRMTEELTESYEAFVKHTDTAVARLHALEELADATHFLVELFLYAGLTVEQCMQRCPTFPLVSAGSVDQMYWQATYTLGVATNFLRNKAWKTSQVPTDEGRFRQALLESWEAHLAIWANMGLNEAALFTFYFRKSEVNKFRQRSAY